MVMDTYLCGVNPEYVGKPDAETLRFKHKGFDNIIDAEITNDTLFQVIAVHGYATCSIIIDTSKGRQNDNIYGSRLFQLDFDNTLDPHTIINDSFYRSYGLAYYSSASYGKEQQPLEEHDIKKFTPEQHSILSSKVGKPKDNCRIVFRTKDIILAKDITPLVLGLFELYPLADRSCKDDARLFFGSKNAVVTHFNDQYLVGEVLDDLISLGRDKTIDQVSHNALLSSSSTIAPGSQFYGWLNIKLINGKQFGTDILFNILQEGYEHRQSCYSPFREDKHHSCFIYKTKRSLVLYDCATRDKTIIRVSV